MKVKELIESCSQKINYYSLKNGLPEIFGTNSRRDVIKKYGDYTVYDFHIYVNEQLGVVFAINYIDEEL